MDMHTYKTTRYELKEPVIQSVSMVKMRQIGADKPCAGRDLEESHYYNTTYAAITHSMCQGDAFIAFGLPAGKRLGLARPQARSAGPLGAGSQ